MIERKTVNIKEKSASFWQNHESRHCFEIKYKVSKVGNLSREWIKDSLFYSYYTEAYGRALLHYLELLYFTLDPYLIMMNVKQSRIKYHFWVFGMTRPGIEPWSPRPLAKWYRYISWSEYIICSLSTVFIFSQHQPSEYKLKGDNK